MYYVLHFAKFFLFFFSLLKSTNYEHVAYKYNIYTNGSIMFHNLKYIESGTETMLHVKVRLFVCVCVALQRFLSNHSTYESKFSV